MDFIEGRHIQRRLGEQAEGASNGHLSGFDKTPDISPLVGLHRSEDQLQTIPPHLNSKSELAQKKFLIDVVVSSACDEK